ncbi:MAG: MBL fold metallo-hydrolase [Chloroflexi bacterium]|nr:MBL fold metallo-hydrolase [Chloroflexota bacterium]
MFLETMVVGPLGVNCYLVGDDTKRDVIVIDPGGDARKILDALAKRDLRVSAIVNTHAHFDHVGALTEIREATHAPFMLHADDVQLLAYAQQSAAMFGLAIPQPTPPEKLLQEGETITVNALSLRVLHTPGHTPGGICLLYDKYVFVGDTLFQGSIGRTDLPGGDYGTLMKSIGDKLFPLPDETIVYPGHGPATTMRDEKLLNPFLRPLMTGQWNV